MLAREYTAGPYSNYSPAEFGAFLAGLELVDPPGIADARHLTAGRPAPAVPDHVRMLDAVARVPGRATSPDT